MNRSILARIVLAVTAVALVPLQQPEAYTLKTAKWNTMTVPYYVNPGNRDVSTQAVVTAIESGASGWTDQSNTPFRLTFAGLTASTSVGNVRPPRRVGSSGASAARRGSRCRSDRPEWWTFRNR